MTHPVGPGHGPASDGVPQPLEIRRAALGIYIVSLCYLVLAVFAILTRDAAVVASRESDTNLTDAEIVSAVNLLVLIAVVVGISVGVVGFVSAINLARGRRWARVTATVAIAVALLFSLLGLLGSGWVAVVVHMLVILSGSAAMFYLYRRASNAFFASPRTP